jgi:hypothetical protein
MGAQESMPAHAPRSPRLLISFGLTDTFSEPNLLQNFRRPKRTGKGRYAWVHWAHRLSTTEGIVMTPVAALSPRPWHISMSASQNSRAESVKGGEKVSERGPKSRKPLATPNLPPQDLLPDEASFSYQCAAGLEFVEGWSWLRVGLALGLVVVLALAGMLLWVFLGMGGLPASGFKDAGGRIGTGALLGAFVLLVGWSLVLGWAGVSWLVK